MFSMNYYEIEEFQGIIQVFCALKNSFGIEDNVEKTLRLPNGIEVSCKNQSKVKCVYDDPFNRNLIDKYSYVSTDITVNKKGEEITYIWDDKRFLISFKGTDSNIERLIRSYKKEDTGWVKDKDTFSFPRDEIKNSLEAMEEATQINYRDIAPKDAWKATVTHGKISQPTGKSIFRGDRKEYIQ